MFEHSLVLETSLVSVKANCNVRTRMGNDSGSFRAQIFIARSEFRLVQTRAGVLISANTSRSVTTSDFTTLGETHTPSCSTLSTSMCIVYFCNIVNIHSIFQLLDTSLSSTIFTCTFCYSDSSLCRSTGLKESSQTSPMSKTL